MSKNIARILFVGPYYWKIIVWGMFICIVVFTLTLMYGVARYSGKVKGQTPEERQSTFEKYQEAKKESNIPALIPDFEDTSDLSAKQRNIRRLRLESPKELRKHIDVVKANLQKLAETYPNIIEKQKYRVSVEKTEKLIEILTDSEALDLIKLDSSSAPALPELEYDDAIELHASALLRLSAGSSRGSITFPLSHGTMHGTDTRVYFVLTESSDAEFAKEFGIMWSRRLNEVPFDVIEDHTVFFEGHWQFTHNPGLVAHVDAAGKLINAVPDPGYSPVTRISWQGRDITVNAPFLQWGSRPGESLQMDKGACSFSDDADPAECINYPPNQPLQHYGGGQVLTINIPDHCQKADAPNPCGSVTMKLHRGIYDNFKYPYLTIFDASNEVAAAKLGIALVPRLEKLVGSKHGLASLLEFGNSIPACAGGPEKIQSGLTSYASQLWSTYSPILQVTWLYFGRGVDCRDYPSDTYSEAYGIIGENNILRQDVTNLMMRGVLQEKPPYESVGLIEAETGSRPFLLNAPSPVTVRH